MAIATVAAFGLPSGGGFGITNVHALEAVSKAIVVRAPHPGDPRYAAMRSEHLGLAFLWRERGAVFVGLFADGTHEVVGDALPDGVSIASLRRAANGRGGDFAAVVIGTGGRLLYGSERPVSRAVLLSVVGGSGPAETAAASVPPPTSEPVPERATVVPVPRMRPRAVAEAIPVPAIDPVTTASVDARPEVAIVAEDVPIALRWAPEARSRPATGDAVANEVTNDDPSAWTVPPRPADDPSGWTVPSRRADDPANWTVPPRIAPKPSEWTVPPYEVAHAPRERREVAPGFDPLPPRLPESTLRRVREAHLRTRLMRNAERDGFETSYLSPPGVRLLARLRFRHGPPVSGPPDRLTASDACTMEAAPVRWLAFVDRRMEGQTVPMARRAVQPRRAASNQPSPASTVSAETYSAPNDPA